MRDRREVPWPDPRRRFAEAAAGQAAPASRTHDRPIARRRLGPALEGGRGRLPAVGAGVGLALVASAIALHLFFFRRAKRELGF